MWTWMISIYNKFFGIADYLQSPALLLARFYLAWVFFKSGLTKLRDWESTLFLFEYEYAVPVLPYELAAYLATIGELVLPTMLVFGIFTRKGAAGIFVINLVAVFSLPDMPEAAFNLHLVWGVLSALIAIWGPGRFALDKPLNIR